MNVPQFIAIALIIICAPLSLLLLIFWGFYPAAIVVEAGVVAMREGLDHAFFDTLTMPMAVFHARMLIGTFGGAVGWVALLALAVVSQRPWSQIPRAIKAGCLVGAASALAIPFAYWMLALPPILLASGLLWQAAKRKP